MSGTIKKIQRSGSYEYLINFSTYKSDVVLTMHRRLQRGTGSIENAITERSLLPIRRAAVHKEHKVIIK